MPNRNPGIAECSDSRRASGSGGGLRALRHTRPIKTALRIPFSCLRQGLPAVIAWPSYFFFQPRRFDTCLPKRQRRQVPQTPAAPHSTARRGRGSRLLWSNILAPSGSPGARRSFGGRVVSIGTALHAGDCLPRVSSPPDCRVRRNHPRPPARLSKKRIPPQPSRAFPFRRR